MLWPGLSRCFLRAAMGPRPVMAVWEVKPRKAIMAKRAFLISFSRISSLRMPSGSKGAEFRKPDCKHHGGREARSNRMISIVRLRIDARDSGFQNLKYIQVFIALKSSLKPDCKHQARCMA